MSLTSTAAAGMVAAAALLAATAQATRQDLPGRAAAVQRIEGAIVRGPLTARRLALVFTGHEYAEGAATILDALGARRARASFFLTGIFLRTPAFAPIVRRMVSDGHYVGPHSDAHLLYSPWTGPKVTLVSRETFTSDLDRNYQALAALGVSRSAARFFLPPYEWYNEEIAAWTHAHGSTLVCHTPGTRSNADYTEEGTPQFVSSQAIYDSILRRERDDPHGLNGFMLLLHVGAGPGRADKFHRRFGDLLAWLTERGYELVGVDTLLEGEDSGFRVQGFRGSGFTAPGSGFRVQGS